MTRDVQCCSPNDTLARAAHIMWECDCGVFPVVEEGRRLAGILTDRDICMAGYTKGRPLQEIRVDEVMTRSVKFVRPNDTVEAVERLMRTHQIRRVPVVENGPTVVGMLALGDLAC